MATTPHVGLTLVEQAQAQKEVTVNMALMRIDALLNSHVIDKDLTAPPASPAEGDVYIVGTPATGEWEGHEDDIAYFEQVWRFIRPNEGLMFWVRDESTFYVFDGSYWSVSSGGSGGEVNTGQNANGAAGGVFKGKVSTNLVLNNIVGGANVTVTGGGATGGDIVISATGSGGGAAAMGDLGDVTLAALSDGQVLSYDASASAWKNRSPASAGLATATHHHTLAEILDAGALAAKSTIGNADWAGAPLSVAHGGTGLTTVAEGRLLRGGASTLEQSGVTVDAEDCLSGFRGSVKVVTGAAYTLALADGGRILECQHGAAMTVTLPASLPRGFTVTVVQTGAGQVIFSAAGAAQLRNSSNHHRTAAQYSACTLYVSANTGGNAAVYIMAGDSI